MHAYLLIDDDVALWAMSGKYGDGDECPGSASASVRLMFWILLSYIYLGKMIAATLG